MPYSNDRFIDPAMAHALPADAYREQALVAWVVLWDAVGVSGAGCGVARSGDV